MKVLVFVKATPESEAGQMPEEQRLAEMGRFNEELVNAGIILAGEGLHPSSKGVRVHLNGSDRTVIDGPFAETKELVAGFWIWKVNSMQEAVDMTGESILEIRPAFEPEDFGEALPRTGRMPAQTDRRTVAQFEVRANMN